MTRFRSVSAFKLLCPLLLGFVCLAGAVTQNERIVNAIPPEEKASIDLLETMSLASLDSIADTMTPEKLEGRTREILALGNLSVGSRPVDSAGDAPIHRYLRAFLSKLAPYGAEELGTIRGEAVAPVMIQPTEVSVGGKVWPMYPIWPNGAMPSITPRDGLSGPLVDVENADWTDIEGLELDGAIALMNFRGGRNYERLFALGAKAVVVMEDDRVSREAAEGLFHATPTPEPRFYVDRQTGDQLQQLAARKQYLANGEFEVTEGEVARVVGGSIYQRVPFQSIFAWLPPSKPVRFTVTESSLLDAIADSSGVSAAEIMRASNLQSPVVRSGDALTIPKPGGDETYKVPPGELLTRLSRQYAIPVAELEKVNSLTSRELEPGQEIEIPNLPEPLVVMLPISSVSVAPDVPHGAHVAGNIATTMAILEHLATSPTAARRRGLVVGFLDAETIGGLSSRTFAESLLVSRGELRNDRLEEDGNRLENYRTIGEWFKNPSSNPLSEETARWFGEDWLLSKIETERVAAAEKRVELREARDDANQSELAEVEERIANLRTLRDSSIGNGSLPWPERITAFFEDPILPDSDKTALGFSRSSLKQRFERELTDEEMAVRNTAGNHATVEAVLAKLNGATRNDPLLGFYLDLSSGSPNVAVSAKLTSNDSGARKPPFQGSYVKDLVSRFRKTAALAATRAGWQQDFAIVNDADAGQFAIQETDSTPYYPDFWKESGIALTAFSAANDFLPLLDTPHDTADNINFDNLAVQGRTALLFIANGIESATDSLPPSNLLASEYGKLVGGAYQFNVRSGIDAQEPVPNATVYYPAISEKTMRVSRDINKSAFRGTRPAIVELTRLNGQFSLPVEDRAFANPQGDIFAFRLNPVLGVFDKAADAGRVGTQEQKPEFNLIPGETTEKRIVLSSLHPLVIYPGTDPVDYHKSTEQHRRLIYTINDVVREGAAEHFAVISPIFDFQESDVAGTLIFMPPDRRARIAMNFGGLLKMFLAGEPTEEHPKGSGHRIGVGRNENRNLTLAQTPLEIAREWQEIAENRQELYEQYGLRDQVVANALEASSNKIAQAEEAIEQNNWLAGTGLAREAWGIVQKNYPRILRLGREAVFSVIILMALLLPACVFLERLFIGAKTILGRLAAASLLFIAGVIFLRFFHPAFQISVSPFIVMIAFTMILMSVVVLGICYQRFEILLRRARAAGGEVEGDKVSLADSLATAMSLGVSNLKKRMSRTILTVLTVSVLTFSIVAFVSVSGKPVVSGKPIELEAEIAGLDVDPLPPAYEGALFREYFWSEVPEITVSALRTEFGGSHDVTARGWYIQVEGGSAVDREGTNQIAIDYGGKKAIVTGVMTFEPNEPKFSGLDSAVSPRTWFKGADPAAGIEADRFKIILPNEVATELGITAAALADPSLPKPMVRMMNHEWEVIGILDTDQADRIRDINGKSLAMVDYLRSAINDSVEGELEAEPDSHHMSWKNLVLVPEAASTEVKAKTRTVAIRFEPDTNQEQFYEDVALRLNKSFYGTRNGELALISTREQINLAGLAKVIVPVILCVLIVANTMLGAVEERRGEVSMLGAIGLSPSQISFLLLAESAVFSVLGIVFGVFAGLFFANIVPWIAANTGGVLGTLSFNFTSITSMLLAISTGVVVLLATLIPARKAAALAAPSGMSKWRLPEPEADGSISFRLPFTLTRGNAVGMLAFFRRFMLNHTDPTSSDFNCRNVKIGIERDPEDALALTAMMWLSPYDLDVAQRFALRMHPSGHGTACEVIIHLLRTSGTEDAWIRTNYGFLDLVRRQFLLWRHLDNDARAKYIEEGANALRETEVIPV